MKNELRSELRLILTPKMLHYLAVLQLPILDLIQTLKNEVETNPALEEIEPEGEESSAELDNIFDELELYMPSSREQEINFLENIPTPPENIFSHLEREIKIRLKGEELRIALAMLYDLDHEGFIHTPEVELAAGLNADIEMVGKIRKKLQRIDPIGCFSYNSIEAIKIQLESDGYGPDSQEYQTIERLAQSGAGEINDLDPQIIKRISKYNPKPGLKFSSEMPQYVVPDIVVGWQGNRLISFLNEDPIPKVRLRREIIDIIKAPGAFSKDEVRFAREKLRSARNLLSSIVERKQTLNQLTDILVKTQINYFKKGNEYLKPLTMKYVAECLNLSISTISRAVSGKYLESPRGIMELKKFFVSGRMPEKKWRITKRIKGLIASERNNQPLSDAAIAETLKKEGLIVSRRTIAKYRQELGYGKQGQRRKNDQ